MTSLGAFELDLVLESGQLPEGQKARVFFGKLLAERGGFSVGLVRMSSVNFKARVLLKFLLLRSGVINNRLLFLQEQFGYAQTICSNTS